MRGLYQVSCYLVSIAWLRSWFEYCGLLWQAFAYPMGTIKILDLLGTIFFLSLCLKFVLFQNDSGKVAEMTEDQVLFFPVSGAVSSPCLRLLTTHVMVL